MFADNQADRISFCRKKWDTVVPHMLQIDQEDGGKGTSLFTYANETNKGKQVNNYI